MRNDSPKSLLELERALARVPEYARWRAMDPGPASSVEQRFDALPATTKAQLRAGSPSAFVPLDSNLHAALAQGEVQLVETSGTTGGPATLVWSQPWWDASEAASWTLNSVAHAVATGGHREAVLASAGCVGPGRSKRPLSVQERTMGRLLFLSQDSDVDHWSEATIQRMVDELRTYAPVVLEADPAYLAAFCARARALDLRLPRPWLVVFTYGLPSRIHTARISQALPVPTASSYGCTEAGYVLMSCERGWHHQNVSHCRVDFVPLQRDNPHGTLGKLLVTPLGHPFTCLLRFDVGDLVRVARGPCGCGRTDGLLVERLEGRVEDATQAVDGHLVTLAALDDVMAAAPCAEHMVSYQLDQSGPAAYLMKVTSDGSLDLLDLTARLTALYGAGAHVEVRCVDALEPEASGKYRLARTRFPVDRDAWFGLPSLSKEGLNHF